MAVEHREKLLARQNKYQLNVGTEDAPLWRDIQLRTNQSASHSPVNADTTTSDDEGFASHIPAQTSQTITLDGLLGYVNLATGVQDYGQVALAEWADTPGPFGIRQFRIVRPDGVGTCHLMWASASQTASGGPLNEADKLSYQITRSGKPEVIQLGISPALPTAITPTPSATSISYAYTPGAAGNGFAAAASTEVFVYEAATDKEVGWVVKVGAGPVVANGLTSTTAYYARFRSVSATGAISELGPVVGPTTTS